jgi:hypothetical protein
MSSFIFLVLLVLVFCTPLKCQLHVTLGEERRLRVQESEMVRRICGRKVGEVAGGSRNACRAASWSVFFIRCNPYG